METILKFGQVMDIGNLVYIEREINIMITLLRKIRLCQLRTKWQLAIWQFIDKQLMEIVKNPEEIEKKIIPYLAEIIHSQNNNTPKTDK